MMTPSLIEVCYTAILEAERYPAATRVYAEHGPKRAIAVVSRILDRAVCDGHIDLVDCEAGARRFLAMLRGDVHLQAVLQIGRIPTPAELDLRDRKRTRLNSRH